MTKEQQVDYETLRYREWEWQDRFKTRTNPNLSSLIELRTKFWHKYGFDELDRITLEVQREILDRNLAEDRLTNPCWKRPNPYPVLKMISLGKKPIKKRNERKQFRKMRPLFCR